MIFKFSIKKIIILFGVLITFYFGYKLYKYNVVKNTVESIDNTIVNDLLNKYMYINNEFPENTDEFNEFVKEYNVNLYKHLNSIEYHFLFKNKDGKLDLIDTYMDGFDNQNDSLVKENYTIETVGFWSSLIIKGDFLFTSKTLPKENIANTIYEVNKDSLILIDKLDMTSLFSNALNCDSILVKDIFADYKTSLVRIENETIDFHYSSFSKRSKKLFKKELSKSNLFKKDRIYIINLKAYETDNVDCVPSPLIEDRKLNR